MPIDLERVQQADMSAIESLIADLDAELKAARPQDKAALISAAFKARYFRRNMLRGLAKEAAQERQPEAPAVTGDVSRARAQAAKLRSEVSPLSVPEHESEA